MLEQSLGILFYQKKRAGYIKGDLPIYLRITVNGSRVEIGTKQHCEPDRWNSQAQRVKGTNEASRSLNAFLDTCHTGYTMACFFGRAPVGRAIRCKSSHLMHKPIAPGFPLLSLTQSKVKNRAA